MKCGARLLVTARRYVSVTSTSFALTTSPRSSYFTRQPRGWSFSRHAASAWARVTQPSSTMRFRRLFMTGRYSA